MANESIITFIDKIVETTKILIKNYEDYVALTGEQKKQLLDAEVTKYYDQYFDYVKLPFWIKGWVKKNLRKQIPHLTQIIYNLLRSYVAGVTKLPN